MALRNALHPESRLLAVRARNRGAAFRQTGRFANPAFWPCGRGTGEQHSDKPAALPIPPFDRAGAGPGSSVPANRPLCQSRLFAVRARGRGAAFRPTGRFANPAFWPCGRGAGEQRSGQKAALPIPPFCRAGAGPGSSVPANRPLCQSCLLAVRARSRGAAFRPKGRTLNPASYAG